MYKGMRGETVLFIEAPRLCRTVSSIFQAAGVAGAVSDVIADSLVDANLEGHDSHGVVRVVEYLDKISGGEINPLAEPEIVSETPTTMRVDGNQGFGQLVAAWTMERLINKADAHKLAMGGIFHCGHVGRAGTYPTMAAIRGMVSPVFVSGGGSKPRVTPFGGRRPVFGTNPIAAAVPVADGAPIVLDFSTSVVASGKIRHILDKGEKLPSGWILDQDGNPSRRAQDYYDGGMLLPAAAHKGYALGLLVEVLGGLLTGAGSLALPDSGYEVGNGMFIIVFNVNAFRAPETLATQVKELCNVIKATPALEEDGQVLLPGEPEHQIRKERSAEGIPVPVKTWSAIEAAAKKLGVDMS